MPLPAPQRNRPSARWTRSQAWAWLARLRGSVGAGKRRSAVCWLTWQARRGVLYRLPPPDAEAGCEAGSRPAYLARIGGLRRGAAAAIERGLASGAIYQEENPAPAVCHELVSANPLGRCFRESIRASYAHRRPRCSHRRGLARSYVRGHSGARASTRRSIARRALAFLSR
jgi:hypothetical protein